MNRSTTGEVQTTHIEYPSGGVPCPAGYWVIYKGCPNKHKDYAGT